MNGNINYKITADKWPRSVYQNSVYNRDNDKKGLFKSKLFLQTWMHVFTSPESTRKFQEAAGASTSDEENIRPSSGEPPPKKRKRSIAVSSKLVAKKISMRRATGRSIVYAGVLHRFNLSDAPQWVEINGDFDYVLYYNNIVNWFENAPRPISQKVDDLLAWWDQRVFPASGRSEPEPSGSQDSSVLRMHNKCAERERIA
ncbi:hypothetical protein C8R44DRAFT_866465 [Mycena epipterygia]|nr:hypothetical protein C8R44DRAFT_866465 [Mycena epipterygia]